MKEERTGCLVCGQELVYDSKSKLLECYLCQEKAETEVFCQNNHYICDQCHSAQGEDFIKSFCLRTKLTDPLEIAFILMKNQSIKMHGPEHHFLVPEVLLTAYYNSRNEKIFLINKIAQVEKRAFLIKGGFCGSHGNCGAAVGTGIFISLVTEATPLSKEEWGLSNLMTSQALVAIAKQGGPRCCKRNSFIAIREAVKFLKDNFNHDLKVEKKNCEFSSLNKECQKEKCPFYVPEMKKFKNSVPEEN